MSHKLGIIHIGVTNANIIFTTSIFLYVYPNEYIHVIFRIGNRLYALFRQTNRRCIMSGECEKCNEHALDCSCAKRKWNPHCDCGQEKSYNEQWDAYFCAKCEIWLEPMCKDKDCDYCVHRPEKPLHKQR